MNVNIPDGIEVIYDLPLSKYCSLRIGGAADMAIFPKTIEEFVSTLNALTQQNIRFDVIGNASNILFDDKGYRGALVFTRNMCSVKIEQTDGGAVMLVDCGKKLTELAMESIRRYGLRGLEFAYGIPGTLGGAVYMNAGAYGGEIKDIVTETVCYDVKKKEIVTLTAGEHCFGYRRSIFQSRKDLIILTSRIKLQSDNGTALERAQANMQSRRDKQPLNLPNAGSAFKRPEGYIAAKLIDDCGLKGLTVGGAQVSQKHAGFFVNIGGATSSDILSLAKAVRSRVKDSYGVDLELEIIYIPENH